MHTKISLSLTHIEGIETPRRTCVLTTKKSPDLWKEDGGVFEPTGDDEGERCGIE